MDLRSGAKAGAGPGAAEIVAWRRARLRKIAGAGPGAAEIVAWRRARLRKIGFETDLAEQLSRECGVDLHALIELVEHGCPPHLAARILAPLERERREC